MDRILEAVSEMNTSLQILKDRHKVVYELAKTNRIEFIRPII